MFLQCMVHVDVLKSLCCLVQHNVFYSVQQMHFAVITFNFLIQSNISFSYLKDAA